MSELSEGARRALQRAREAYQPHPEQLARVRDALNGLNAASSAAVTAKTTAATLSAKLVVAGKLSLAVLTVTGATALWSAQRDPRPQLRTAVPAVQPVSEPSDPPTPALPVLEAPLEISEVTGAQQTPVSARRKSPEKAATTRKSGAQKGNSSDVENGSADTTPNERSHALHVPARGRDESTPAVVPSSARSMLVEPAERVAEPTSERLAPKLAPPSDALAREIALLSAARRELNGGNARQSLTLLDTYLARFPRGVMREEALASRTSCLCHLGRGEEARRSLGELQALSPHSAHLQKLRSQCGELTKGR